MPNYLSLLNQGNYLDSLIFDDKLNILAYERVFGGTNYYLNSSMLIERRIEDVICSVCEKSGVYNISEIYSALGGIFSPMASSIQRLLPAAILKDTTEAFMTQLSANLYEKGCVVISNSGSSIAYIHNENIYEALGGYGPTLGDEGSGYYIAHNAIRAAIRYLGGWGSKTILAKLLIEYTGRKTPHDIVSFFHHDTSDFSLPHSKILGFLPKIKIAYETSDHVTLGILEKAGILLAKQTVALFKKEKLPEDTVISLCGDTWSLGGTMIDAFINYMKNQLGDVYIQRQQFSTVVGGVIYYLHKNGIFEEKKDLFFEKFKSFKIEQ